MFEPFLATLKALLVPIIGFYTEVYDYSYFQVWTYTQLLYPTFLCRGNERSYSLMEDLPPSITERSIWKMKQCTVSKNNHQFLYIMI